MYPRLLTRLKRFIGRVDSPRMHPKVPILQYASATKLSTPTIKPRPLTSAISPTHISKIILREGVAGHLFPLFGNSVFSSVHRNCKFGEEGLLSWHSAFPCHGSILVSLPRQSALLTYAILQLPTYAFHPCAFTQALPIFCPIGRIQKVTFLRYNDRNS